MATLTAKGAQTALITVQDMTGGLDRRTTATLLKPARARRLQNVRLSVAGRLIPRPGWMEMSDASLGNARMQGGTRAYLEGTDPFLLAAFNGEVYRPSDAGVMGSAVLTGLDTTNAIDFPFDSQIVAALDGVTAPKKSVDGTTWTPMGITAPVAGPTLTVINAGGTLTDAHTFGVAYGYRDSALGLTSNVGPTLTIATAAPNLTIHVVMAASADTQVDQVDVYAMDLTLGETVLRYAGTVANSGTPTLDLLTNNWSDSTEAPTTHDVPPPLEFAQVWKNRWWAKAASGPTTLQFSEIFQNQVWPADYTIEIPFPTGDEIRAIVPLGDLLVIFGSSHPGFIIFGQTSLDFDVRPTAGIEAGVFGFRAWDFVESGIAHAAPEGVYVFDGSSDRLLSYDFENDWRQMSSAGPEADLRRMAVCYHQRDKELRVAVSDNPIYGAAGEWVLDLARTKVSNIPAWSTTNRAIGGFISWDGPEPDSDNRGRLWSWALETGTLNEESVGMSANGADMDASYAGPDFNVPLKVSRFTELYGEYRGASGLFGVTIRVDGKVALSTSVDIGAGISQYGSAQYGTAQYGGAGRSMFTVDLPLSAEGRTVSYEWRYQGQAVPEFYTYGLEYQPEPEVRGIN